MISAKEHNRIKKVYKESKMTKIKKRRRIKKLISRLEVISPDIHKMSTKELEIHYLKIKP